MQARAANGRAGEGDWMRIFAIGDLHLSGAQPKSMDVFGRHWARHWDRIRANWREVVQPQDVVLVPGDISWAMDLGGAQVDLDEICQMPGQKVLLRGNHDYWWSSLSQLRACLPENMHAVQNDAFDAGDCVFCGTRGWTIPLGQNATAQDEKLYRREALRLEMSLKDAARIANGRPIFAMMHYPPLLPETARQGTEFTRLLSEYGVKRCVYGHLHGQSVQRGFSGSYRGVRYDLVSCDALGFALKDVSLEAAEG